MTQRYLKVAHQQKLDALTRILEVENFDGMIIFVRTKHATEDLAERLRARGFAAAAINGDVAQVQRERTIDQLRKGKLDILVATDVAARGLDVDRISHVINHDIPTDTESYVHRIGRTGRAGRSGQAISFVTPRENYLLRAIEKANRTTLEQMNLPSVEDVNAFRVAKFTESITNALARLPARDLPRAGAVLRAGARRAGGRHRGRDRRTRAGRRAAAPRGHARADGPRERERRDAVGELVRWRISVGKRHRVEPRQIVGALANEGGLKRADFGRIDIKPNFSLVELPPDLSQRRSTGSRTPASPGS